ncbi:CHC2 zinc finger domain-containing protein [Neobacillus sp. NRS-1170]|uniref:CHC2 zinc finger domain-containing protein n=1 Tax=Neobacillus sp. NRS-1170 TaxID=3233898 RepID=UPI003D2B3C2C
MIDQIKKTIPITDALERYAGVNFIKTNTRRRCFNIRCPYHNDRSPSFSVYTDTNSFFCWAGCNDGKAGSVIDIVKLSLNIDYYKAVETIKNDYVLTEPDSAQAKEWLKKRLDTKLVAALQKKFNKKLIQSIDKLKWVQELSIDAISRIKTPEDLEQVGDWYHIIRQVEYWLECLIDDDPDVQFKTLEEVNGFIKEINGKVF